MLAPDSRAVLLDLLRPPPGFELGHAVATTFTLDLSAALVPPLAFVARGLSKAASQVSLLTAVRSISDRIDVFCQAGQIAVPRSSSRLIDFVEPMVHPVHEPRPGYLFHPKVWFLEFLDEGGTSAYRLVVQSRNLTNDASWDAVVSLDGILGTRRYASNGPLVGLLSGLPARTVQPIHSRRAARIAGLAERFRRVEWTAPDGVREVAFHVFGVPGHPPRSDFSGYRNLVVSPFLTAGGLNRVSGPGGDIMVVSRPEAFDVLDPAAVAGIQRAFIVNPLTDLLENDNPNEEVLPSAADDAPHTVRGGLHAKFFVVERARLAHVFIGSANATDPAFTGNVEILVEMVGSIKEFGVDAMLGKQSLGPILEPYAAVGGMVPDNDEEARYRLDQFLRRVAAITLSAEVVGADSEYRVHFTGTQSISLPDGYQVAVELHTRPGFANHLKDSEPVDAEFGPMPLADVTPLLTVLVTTDDGIRGGAVLIASLINDPPGRFDEILARQLDTPEKFLQFLAQLLGLDGAALLGAGASGAFGAAGAFGIAAPGVFELLVRALADKPRALDTLAELVPLLSGDTERASSLPDGFLSLWETVRRARLDIEGATA